MIEIKRKFLVNKLPDLSKLQKEVFERYFLHSTSDVELRVQKINDRYELERLVKNKNHGREIYLINISKKEFETLKALSKGKIIRDVYLFSNEIEICVYHDKFEGLVRVEVSLNTNEKAKRYKPLDWFGKEITNTPLWRDLSLIDLSSLEFRRLLRRYASCNDI